LEGISESRIPKLLHQHKLKDRRCQGTSVARTGQKLNPRW